MQGTPRITYVKAGQGMSAEAVRELIAQAIKTCTLPAAFFAASMAGKHAGLSPVRPLRRAVAPKRMVGEGEWWGEGER